MSQTPQIEIVTIYNAATTSGARSKIRVLAIVNVLAAAAWLGSVHYKVDPWIGKVAVVHVLAAAAGHEFMAGPLRPILEAQLAAAGDWLPPFAGVRYVPRPGAGEDATTSCHFPEFNARPGWRNW